MRNLLLASLPPDELTRLTPSLTLTDLVVGQCLQTDGGRLERVYFPESGLMSVLGGSGERRVEAAIVGRDGMVGASALLGSFVSPHRVMVRVPGVAWALSTGELMQARDENPGLHDRLMTFIGAWIVQMEQTICAIGRCTVDQRLASWLLMAHDRLDEDDLDITHDCLANTLGVRRPGVTVALHVLEGELAVRSKRGRITIRDRERLKRLAGEAYSPPKVDVRTRSAARLWPDGTLSENVPAIVQ